MTIADRLSSSLGERSQMPNKELARDVVSSRDQNALNELRQLISAKENTDVVGDALKVVEVMGELDSEFTKDAIAEILPLLHHKSNKIQWRAMSALSTIAEHHLDLMMSNIGEIIDVMNAGSIITKDHGVKILLVLYTRKDFRESVSHLLNEQVLLAPDNQLGQYAEKWSHIIAKEHVNMLIKTLETRATDLYSPSHQKRIARVLKKLNKL